MGSFYHFSHFLEFLSGIYFGGFALLSFIEDGASVNIYSKIKFRESEAKKSTVLVNEFFNINLKTPSEGIGRFLSLTFLWVVYYIFQKSLAFFSALSNVEIRKIAGTEQKNILQKKFFPSFFFAGCFCFMLILLTAVQSEGKDSQNCQRAIDIFIMYYALSSLLFQIWALGVLPRLVRKNEYVHLTAINALIGIVLLVISLVLSAKLWIPDCMSFFLMEKNEKWLHAILIFITVIPLLFIVINSIFVLISWELPILFNSLVMKLLSPKKEIEEAIEASK